MRTGNWMVMLMHDKVMAMRMLMATIEVGKGVDAEPVRPCCGLWSYGLAELTREVGEVVLDLGIPCFDCSQFRQMSMLRNAFRCFPALFMSCTRIFSLAESSSCPWR